jgi:hypothetical protein
MPVVMMTTSVVVTGIRKAVATAADPKTCTDSYGIKVSGLIKNAPVEPERCVRTF